MFNRNWIYVCVYYCVVYLQPGAALGIQYMDTFKWTAGFGVKDKSIPDLHPQSDTIFRIGSVSKVFAVSYAVT